eukprot:CAMPEP_0197849678 /NCGR_PEP_ID=MMETSP1438-20131217/12868_1 /TAXON_ID=1461541 /ORGANISM="Pterosperma sp., Strain CCMP1384" /LENGTH=383 /DNA_ID=CAMNT_0043462461 /DNA_START=65 /DNA_END=1216 /DNA_ORIENTATION=-
MSSVSLRSPLTSVQQQKLDQCDALRRPVVLGSARATPSKAVSTVALRSRRAVQTVSVAASKPEADFPPGHQNSQWPTGIPPVMGGHVMPSGEVAPKSESTGPGTGAIHMFQYYDSGKDFTILVHKDEAEVASGLVQMIVDASAAAIAEHGSFSIALSGGSCVGALSGLASTKGVEFEKWQVFFVDERVVPLDSSESNFKAAQDAFLSKVPVPESQVHAIDPTLPPATAASAYEFKLLASDCPRNAAGKPAMDLILLGVGPEGHTASLFPNSVATAEKEALITSVINSPKPPAQRITFTMPLINAANNVVVVASGAGKAEVVERALEMQSLPGALPVQLVRPDGALTWMLDQASAADLNQKEWTNPKAWPRSELPKPKRGAKKK